MPEDFINCGECTIRQGKRVVIRSDICERYKLKENDVIEVYIKKVEGGKDNGTENIELDTTRSNP